MQIQLYEKTDFNGFLKKELSLYKVYTGLYSSAAYEAVQMLAGFSALLDGYKIDEVWMYAAREADGEISFIVGLNSETDQGRIEEFCKKARQIALVPDLIRYPYSQKVGKDAIAVCKHLCGIEECDEKLIGKPWSIFESAIVQTLFNEVQKLGEGVIFNGTGQRWKSFQHAREEFIKKIAEIC